jgi:ubiquitin-protein ligase
MSNTHAHFERSAAKRLKQEIKTILKNNPDYDIYFDKPLEEKEFHKNIDYIYHLIWVLNQTIPLDIIRDHILSHLQFPIQLKFLKKMNLQDINNSLIIKKVICDKEWVIPIRLPNDYPFKPPIYTECYRHFPGWRNNPLMWEIFKNIGYLNWSPAFTLEMCFELYFMMINIHNNLSHKSNFLKLVYNLPHIRNSGEEEAVRRTARKNGEDLDCNVVKARWHIFKEHSLSWRELKKNIDLE